jgi:hypothetical protein
METVITAVIMISLLVLLVFGVAQHLMTSQAVISNSSRALQDRLGERARTGLTPGGATVAPLGDSLSVTLKNTGSTKLADFQQWDVILQYTGADDSSQAKWYAYPTQWTAQIYQSISPNVAEVIEPGILDPGEYVTVQVTISPAVKAGTTNLATIAAPNGIGATMVFTR